MPNPGIQLQRAHSAILAIDLQERLLPAIHDSQSVIRNCARLLQGAAALDLPVFSTEQYRKGLGPTVAAVAEAIRDFAPVEKLAFSAVRDGPLLESLRRAGASQVVLCGVETHVCVLQTCLDLLAADFRVFVCADATSSRTTVNRRLALTRMQQAGAVIASTEMVLFEWLERAGTPQFKAILDLVK